MDIHVEHIYRSDTLRPLLTWFLFLELLLAYIGVDSLAVGLSDNNFKLKNKTTADT